ncbi:MAG: hypothetical protein IT462_09995 [Planctomycetes bacterium]|nr:hypothetical protein [Planctomycetota bacterium]
MPRTVAIIVATFILALGAVFWLDPRTPSYRSRYADSATRDILAGWQRDLRGWPAAPRYRRFDALVAREQARPAPPQQWPAPEFAGSYEFGKFLYRVEVYFYADRILFMSWGSDEQDDIGGAWMAVGEGRRRADGTWFGIWSCLDLTRQVSNGGGAFFEFSPDRRRFHARYYHDTMPFGEAAIEEGDGVLVGRGGIEATQPLEGRVQTWVDALKAAPGRPFTLWGRVVDEQGRGVEGAAVKRRAAGEIETTTDARGFFRLSFEQIEQLTLISAGKLGYANGTVVLEQKTAFRATGPDQRMAALATITLREVDRTDHRDYEFVSPHPSDGPPEALQCANCHNRAYAEWKESRHSTMARNPWLRAAFEKDARPSAIAAGRPDDLCTPCHSPSLAATLDKFEFGGKTLLDATGVHLDGNHCDFCHKIEAVTSPQRAGMAGSIRLLRPNPADDTFPGDIKRVFGPLPDVTFLYMGACYNPLFETGMLCAGCHEHTLEGGLVGQGTYSEWSRTKYSRPGPDYKECQGCHMPVYRRGELVKVPQGDGTFLEAASGDVSLDEYRNNGTEIAKSGTRYRPLKEAHKHSFIGTEDRSFLQSGVSMTVKTERTFGILKLRVKLENIGAGHAIPTGHGLKRLMLLVDGGSEPDAGFLLSDDDRVGEAARAHSGIVIGRRFKGQSLEAVLNNEKLIEDSWAIPFWRASGESQDIRLWPGEPREFTFTLPDDPSYRVKLVLRRAPTNLLRAHGMLASSARVAGAPLDTVIHQWPAR